MRRRIVVATLLVALVAIGILGVPLLVITQNQIGSSAQVTVNHDGLKYALDVEPFVADRSLTAAKLDAIVDDNAYVSVTLSNGQTVATGVRPTGSTLQTTVNIGGGASLTVQHSLADYARDRIETAAIVVIAAALAIGVAVLLAGRVSTRLTTPLSRLADDASRFGEGDLRPSGQRYGIAELDDVARVLDGAALRLADLVRREREFAGDVSHQLRSRLTALSMRLEEVGASTDPNASREAEAALEQVDRMVSVIDDLLEQARNERARSAIPVDVAEQLDNVYDEVGPAAVHPEPQAQAAHPAGARAACARHSRPPAAGHWGAGGERDDAWRRHSRRAGVPAWRARRRGGHRRRPGCLGSADRFGLRPRGVRPWWHRARPAAGPCAGGGGLRPVGAGPAEAGHLRDLPAGATAAGKAADQ
nr:HAMP domain-containing sensor histidine kinase [Fodinicola feengrottensis]